MFKLSDLEARKFHIGQQKMWTETKVSRNSNGNNSESPLHRVENINIDLAKDQTRIRTITINWHIFKIARTFDISIILSQASCRECTLCVIKSVKRVGNKCLGAHTCHYTFYFSAFSYTSIYILTYKQQILHLLYIITLVICHSAVRALMQRIDYVQWVKYWAAGNSSFSSQSCFFLNISFAFFIFDVCSCLLLIFAVAALLTVAFACRQ